MKKLFENWRQKLKQLELLVYKKTLISLLIAVVLIGVIFFVVIDRLPFTEKNSINTIVCFGLSILSSIISAFLCSISLSIMEKKSHLNEQNIILGRLTEIDDKLKITQTDIVDVCTENKYDADSGFDNLYDSSKSSISVLIHGRSFIKRHKNAIISRFDKDGYETKCLFVDPDSKYLEMIARKTGHNVESLKEYINNSVATLKNGYINSNKSGGLEIYYMPLPPMQAVYVFDDKIIECKYYSSSEKGPGSFVVIYKNNGKRASIGYGFVEDCKKLMSEARCIFTGFIYSDDLFKEYLQVMLAKYNIDDFSSHQPDELMFISANRTTYNHYCSFLFSYRYYNSYGNYEKNKNFCISQFSKKSQMLGSSTQKMFFVVGLGGEPTNPREIKIIKYEKTCVFDEIKTIKTRKREEKEFFLKDFGYNPQKGKWES